jgi:hypothetical protein
MNKKWINKMHDKPNSYEWMSSYTEAYKAAQNQIIAQCSLSEEVPAKADVIVSPITEEERRIIIDIYNKYGLGSALLRIHEMCVGDGEDGYRYPSVIGYISKRTGFSRTTVYRIIHTGGPRASSSYIIKLLDALGIKLIATPK